MSIKKMEDKEKIGRRDRMVKLGRITEVKKNENAKIAMQLRKDMQRKKRKAMKKLKNIFGS